MCQRPSPQAHGRTVYRSVPVQRPRHDMDACDKPCEPARMPTSQSNQQHQERESPTNKQPTAKRNKTQLPANDTLTTTDHHPDHPSAANERHLELATSSTNHNQWFLRSRSGVAANLYWTIPSNVSGDTSTRLPATTSSSSTADVLCSSNVNCHDSDGRLIIFFIFVSNSPVNISVENLFVRLSSVKCLLKWLFILGIC
jgi:hypothetical protein